jgi:hypothetical protein
VKTTSLLKEFGIVYFLYSTSGLFLVVTIATIRESLEDPYVDGKVILRWIFRKWDVGTWAGSSWLRIGTGGGHLRVP